MMNCPHWDTSVDEHEAGRCLDAWVAEDIMGKKISDSFPGVVGMIEDRRVAGVGVGKWIRPYSTDIAAAWEVVERGGIWEIKYVNIDALELKPGTWQTLVKFLTKDSATKAYGETVPLAICRAALKSVYVGEDASKT